jgi:hypothetical protein
LRSATARIERLETIGSLPGTRTAADVNALLAALQARLDALEHDVRVLEVDRRKPGG